MKSTERKYDVFISYSHADQKWVWGWLIPRLKAAELAVCTDHESFDIGKPALVNMENAVTLSHHTLLILTPSWVASQWANFEMLLTLHEDPAGLLQRTLPIVLKPCDPPRRIAMLTYADFTGKVDVEAGFNKVLDALRGIQRLPASDSLSDISQSPITKDQKESDTLPVNIEVPKWAIDRLNAISITNTPSSEVISSLVNTGLQTIEMLLAELGFRYDPFAFFEAEKMPSEALEETFVAPRDFDIYIMNMNRSSVLLAPRGDGKTACRLRLEVNLNKIQNDMLSEQILANNSTKVPLVVIYNNFEEITKHLPNISLKDQVDSFLSAVAESILTFITKNPARWHKTDDRTREWWQIFLETYLEGESLASRIQESVLSANWRAVKANSTLFRRNSSLKSVLEGVQRHLVQLGIGSLFILVDNVDGYIKTQPLPNLEALVATWLNALALLSLPNVIWKFFLPDILADVVRHSAGHQTGRLDIVPITWDEQSLSQLLRRRLEWASGGQIQDITQLCDQELLRAVKVEQELIEMALRHRRLGPPRALLDLGSQLLLLIAVKREQSRLLSLDDWNNLRLMLV
jgi:TIR domain